MAEVEQQAGAADEIGGVEATIRECIDITARGSHPIDWETYYTRRFFGWVLLGQKRYSEAEPQLVQGYEGMKQVKNESSVRGEVRQVEILERLVQLYVVLDKPEDERKWRQEIEVVKATALEKNRESIRAIVDWMPGTTFVEAVT